MKIKPKVKHVEIIGRNYPVKNNKTVALIIP